MDFLKRLEPEVLAPARREEYAQDARWLDARDRHVANLAPGEWANTGLIRRISAAIDMALVEREYEVRNELRPI